MNYTETQLEAIKLFGKKDLTEGCILNIGEVKIVNKKAITQWDDSLWRIAQSSCDDAGEWGPEYIKSNRFLITEMFNTCSYQDKKTKEYKLRKIPEGIIVDLSKDTTDYEILGHIPHLEDLFRVAEEKGWLMQLGDTSGIHVGISIRDDKMKIKRVLYRKSLPLLEQPNLSEIISLFR